MKKILITVLFICSAAFIVSADEVNNKETSGSECIEAYPDAVSVRFFLRLPGTDVSFSKNDGTELPNGNKSIDYSSLRGFGGAGISYKEFDVSYGGGSSHAFSTSYYSRKIASQFIYQYDNNFKLVDSNKYPAPVEKERTDVKLRTLGVNAFYIFSDDFSLRSVFDQCERQVKWDWSFLAMTSFHYDNIKSSHSMIPSAYDDSSVFGKKTGYRGGQYYSLGVIPGFGINVPIFRIYLSLGFFVGPGYLVQKSKTDDGTVTSNSVSVLTNTFLGVGYNGETWFWGMNCVNNDMDEGDNIRRKRSVSVRFNQVTADYFVGFRF